MKQRRVLPTEVTYTASWHCLLHEHDINDIAKQFSRRPHCVVLVVVTFLSRYHVLYTKRGGKICTKCIKITRICCVRPVRLWSVARLSGTWHFLFWTKCNNQRQNPKGRVRRVRPWSCCALLVCFILAPAKLSDFTWFYYKSILYHTTCACLSNLLIDHFKTWALLNTGSVNYWW